MTGYINLNSEDELLRYFLREVQKHTPSNLYQAKGVVRSPGAPCPKCQYQAYKNTGQVFSSKAGGLDAFFSKEHAEHLIAQSGRAPRAIPRRLLDYLVWQNEFEEAHVVHVADVHTPGIVAFGVMDYEGAPMAVAFLIDGTHRAVSAMRAGRSFEAYILTPRETAFCETETQKAISAGATRVVVFEFPATAQA